MNRSSTLVFVLVFTPLIVLLMTVVSRQITGAAAETVATEHVAQHKSDSTTDYTLLTAADVKRAFREIPKIPPTNKKIVEEEHYNVAVARVRNRNGGPELHRESDRVFFVKKGKAVMRIGGTITDPKEISPNEIRSTSGDGYTSYREVTIKEGTVLSIPRDIAYQLVAQGNDISFIVVRMN